MKNWDTVVANIALTMSKHYIKNLTPSINLNNNLKR